MKDEDLTRKNHELESAESETIDLSDEQLGAMNGGRDLTSDDSLIDIGRDQRGPVAVVIC